jgi:hypothetical protein
MCKDFKPKSTMKKYRKKKVSNMLSAIRTGVKKGKINSTHNSVAKWLMTINWEYNS